MGEGQSSTTGITCGGFTGWATRQRRAPRRTAENSDAISAEEALTGEDLNADGRVAGRAPRKSFAQAAWQIVIADVSTSLDNVLAVAGAAHGHPTVLIIGLLVSIALMGLAATFVAKLLNRYRWIAYIGLAIIFYVALKMIYEGWHQLHAAGVLH